MWNSSSRDSHGGTRIMAESSDKRNVIARPITGFQSPRTQAFPLGGGMSDGGGGNVPRGWNILIPRGCSIWNIVPGDLRRKGLACSRSGKNSSFVFPTWNVPDGSVPHGTYTSIGLVWDLSRGIDQEAALWYLGGGRNVPVGGQALSVPREHYSILAIPRGSARGEGREILRTGNARNVPRGTFFGGRAGAVWGQIAEVFHVEHFACAQARVGLSLETLPLLPLLCP